MNQATIEEESKIVFGCRCKGQCIYRFVESGKQAAREAERFVLKIAVILDDKIEARHLSRR